MGRAAKQTKLNSWPRMLKHLDGLSAPDGGESPEVIGDLCRSLRHVAAGLSR